MGNIILIGVGLFVVLMVAIGLKRGLVKMAFSLASVFIILILVNILTPSVKQILKATPVYDDIHKSIQHYVDDHIKESTKDMTKTGVNAQKKIIKGLPLPNGVIDDLIENNNQDNYVEMQVESFSEYITESLSDMVLSAITFVLVLIVVTILIIVLICVLNLVTKLPVIRTFNTAGGALIGLVEALVVVWVACIVVTIFSTTGWGQEVCKAIADNGILSYLYDNNPIQNFFMGFFG